MFKLFSPATSLLAVLLIYFFSMLEWWGYGSDANNDGEVSLSS